ncbi:MAG: hypothetical protein ICV73_25020 [Acetobacteraceae bacterium]|nr:hypothetical protein [Acetobacteraceae bacterium]
MWDGTIGVAAFAPAEAAAGAVLAAFAPAGCTIRLLSCHGTIGPYPGDHESLIRDFVAARRHAFGPYEIAHVSRPEPGAVVV